MRGGEIGGDLTAGVNGRIEIIGSEFSMAGEPLPPGPLEVFTARLEAVLESGEVFNGYVQTPPWMAPDGETLMGEVILVPEPMPWHQVSASLVCLLLLRQRRQRISSSRIC